MLEPKPAGADDGPDNSAQLVPVERPSESWLLVAALSMIAFAIIGGTLTSMGVYLPTVQHAFGWSETATGGLPMAMLLGFSLGNLVVGPLMGRLEIRTLVAMGAVLCAVGWALAARLTSLPMLMVAMAMTGLGGGLATIVPGIAAITSSFVARRGLAIGVFIGSTALAGTAVPALSGWLIAEFGWRAAFGISGAAIAAICIPFVVLIQVGRGGPTGVDADAMAATGPGPQAVAKLPSYWRLTIALTISQICMYAILFNIVAMLLRAGYLQGNAVAIYGLSNLMALPGLLIGGVLADRLGARRVLPACLLLQAIGTFCLLGVGPDAGTVGNVAVAAFVLLWGLAGGLPNQVGPMVLAELIGTRAFATMLGVTLTISGLLGALAPAAAGWLYDASGGYALPVGSSGVLAVVAAVLTIGLRRRD